MTDEPEPYWRQFVERGVPPPFYLDYVKPGDIVRSWLRTDPPERGLVIAAARAERGGRPVVLVTIVGSRGAVATWEKWSRG